jgi:hypothetical protein
MKNKIIYSLIISMVMCAFVNVVKAETRSTNKSKMTRNWKNLFKSNSEIRNSKMLLTPPVPIFNPGKIKVVSKNVETYPKRNSSGIEITDTAYILVTQYKGEKFLFGVTKNEWLKTNIGQGLE